MKILIDETIRNKRLLEPSLKPKEDYTDFRLGLQENILNFLCKDKRIVTHGQNGIHIKQTT